MDESGKPTERTIADQLALAIGAIGENMSLRRAIVYNIQPNQHLSWYMHGSTNDPINNCHFGKYGCMVLMTMYKPIDKYQVLLFLFMADNDKIAGFQLFFQK